MPPPAPPSREKPLIRLNKNTIIQQKSTEEIENNIFDILRNPFDKIETTTKNTEKEFAVEGLEKENKEYNNQNLFKEFGKKFLIF